MVLRKLVVKTAIARGIMTGVSAILFSVHDGHAKKVNLATVFETGAISAAEPVRRLHKQDFHNNPSTGLVFIRSFIITDSFKNFSYPYLFITYDEDPETSGDVSSSSSNACGFSIYDLRYRRVKVTPNTAVRTFDVWE